MKLGAAAKRLLRRLVGEPVGRVHAARPTEEDPFGRVVRKCPIVQLKCQRAKHTPPRRVHRHVEGGAVETAGIKGAAARCMRGAHENQRPWTTDQCG